MFKKRSDWRKRNVPRDLVKSGRKRTSVFFIHFSNRLLVSFSLSKVEKERIISWQIAEIIPSISFTTHTLFQREIM